MCTQISDSPDNTIVYRIQFSEEKKPIQNFLNHIRDYSITPIFQMMDLETILVLYLVLNGNCLERSWSSEFVNGIWNSVTSIVWLCEKGKQRVPRTLQLRFKGEGHTG
jgi:hypothetical protein